jgi:hypothetical protein
LSYEVIATHVKRGCAENAIVTRPPRDDETHSLMVAARWMRRSSSRSLPWVGQGADPFQTLHRYEARRMSMACLYTIDMYGPDADALPKIASEALDEVDRIDRLMSIYKPDSAALSDLCRGCPTPGSRRPGVVRFPRDGGPPTIAIPMAPLTSPSAR